MSRLLTIQEKIEIIELRRNATASETARIFNQQHPERVHPLNRATVSKLEQKFNNTGTLHNNFTGGRRTVLDSEERVKNVLDLFRGNEHTTIRGAAATTGHSTVTVQKILKRNKFHPYIQQKHQRLLAPDYEKRSQFCTEYLEQTMLNRYFTRNVLWTDECQFYVNGVVNKQIYR